jgi:hypothetical protein
VPWPDGEDLLIGLEWALLAAAAPPTFLMTQWWMRCSGFTLMQFAKTLTASPVPHELRRCRWRIFLYEW